MIILFAATTIVALGYLLYKSVRKNLELVESLEEIYDLIDESTEALEFYQAKIEKKSKLEILLDDPIVRELTDDIKGAKKAIEKINDKLRTLAYAEDESSAE